MKHSNVIRCDDGVKRCWWCVSDPQYIDYHDQEWGRPVTDEIRLFEKLCLEGFQSGLSWLTILKKRENFRKAFAGFDFEKVSRYGDKDVTRLMADAGIVRNRAKIEATINNAQRASELANSGRSLAGQLWQFRPARSPVLRSRDQVQATTPESIAMSKTLRKQGWKFIGPTTCYALMQAMGMVNDHLRTCDHWQQVEQERKAFEQPS
ncbi:DNA-3-methyladenine glycosylase I [Stieleria varia]|uniref:DNA-3-methyladenine glycosylase 1 n=1 Tax=Stieleria varia TaxID=2528005 RepID=A0A5C6A040_9BACT|nr:DNA-3-methyladenine glycosylase I [Stieleria varia]TWT92677.1 DNA-3-methyladenine glycosylase 1 [Stieleria varia]